MQLIIVVKSNTNSVVISDQNFIEAIGSITSIKSSRSDGKISLYLISTEKTLEEIREYISGIPRFTVWGFWKKKDGKVLFRELQKN